MPERSARRGGGLWLGAALGAIDLLVAGAAGATCGPYEDETRTSYRELSWGDFQGPRPERAPRSGRGPVEIAHVATTLSYRTEVATQREGHEWVARPATLCVQAFMLKDRSGYKREWRTPRHLAHEQGHFDLSHYFAESLQQRLVRLEHRAASERAAQTGLLDRMERARAEAVSRWRRTQTRYDEETRHGHRKRVQLRWLDTIAGLLESLPLAHDPPTGIAANTP